MKVTIKWTNPEKDGKVRAICNVEVLEKSLTLYGVRIVKGDKGIFAAAASTKGKDGKYYSTAFFGEEFSKSVVAEAAEAMKDHKAKPKAKSEPDDDDLPF